MTVLRSSRRLQGLAPEEYDKVPPADPTTTDQVPATSAGGGGTTKPTRNRQRQLPEDSCLPRTRENALLQSNPKLEYIFGVDEAGRGPLAGPVVAAACYLPTRVPGITDSKQIQCESKREALYQRIVESSGCQWAVAVVDAATIDEINILQATLLGMRLTLQALVGPNDVTLPTLQPYASIDFPGTYVVISSWGEKVLHKKISPSACHAIVDGNRLPKDMPCTAETMIKGDATEYAVAAASLLAKVTRDRLMHAYAQRYPDYGLEQHKGYGTAQHVAALRKLGPTHIHRWSFAPLKHWASTGNMLCPKDSLREKRRFLSAKFPRSCEDEPTRRARRRRRKI